MLMLLFEFLLFDFHFVHLRGGRIPALLGEQKVERRGAACTPCFMHNAFC